MCSTMGLERRGLFLGLSQEKEKEKVPYKDRSIAKTAHDDSAAKMDNNNGKDL